MMWEHLLAEAVRSLSAYTVPRALVPRSPFARQTAGHTTKPGVACAVAPVITNPASRAGNAIFGRASAHHVAMFVLSKGPNRLAAQGLNQGGALGLDEELTECRKLVRAIDPHTRKNLQWCMCHARCTG